MLHSYALPRAKRDPLVIPEDYTLVGTCVAFISKTAKYLVNAKRFIHYLIAKDEQQFIAKQSELIAFYPGLEP